MAHVHVRVRAKLFDMRDDGRGQAHAVQNHGSQPLADAAHLSGHVTGHAGDCLKVLLHPVRHVAHPLDFQGQGGKLLSELIVQLPGQACALFLLCGDNLAGQGLKLLIGPGQFVGALVHEIFEVVVVQPQFFISAQALHFRAHAGRENFQDVERAGIATHGFVIQHRDVAQGFARGVVHGQT